VKSKKKGLMENKPYFMTNAGIVEEKDENISDKNELKSG